MSEFWDKFKEGLSLTSDDIGHVRDLLSHPGWEVLTHKVYPMQELNLLVQGRQAGGEETDKGSFIAGKHAGLQLSQTLAEKTGRPSPDQPEPQRKRGKVHRSGYGGSKPLS